MSISARTQWMLVLMGLCLLYEPTYLHLSQTLWRADEYSHAPLIALVAAWLLWRSREAIFMETAASPSANRWGAVSFILGLLLQVIGRSQDIALLEMASQIPVFAGILLMLNGLSAMRAAWFPLVFLLFMIPLPGILIDILTSQLKEWISLLCELLLYQFGLPVARNGVVISIGPYQMLVADACSGLYSMFSLSALGVLFIHFSGRALPLQRFCMLLSILPIAFVANLARVILLVLVTYYMGDGYGRWMHDMASPAIFMIAMFLLFSLDRGLDRFFGTSAR